MLNQIQIKRYKSLYDVTIPLRPLTVLLGPGGTGKTSFCEALFVLSHLLKWRSQQPKESVSIEPSRILEGAARLPKYQNWANKFWREQNDFMAFELTVTEPKETIYPMRLPSQLEQVPDPISEALAQVMVYHFSSGLLSQEGKPVLMTPTGEAIANTLAAISLDKPDRFAEVEKQLLRLVPHVSGISLRQQSKYHRDYHTLRLVDRHSRYTIPVTDVSDSTLRVLAFLTALYQVETPTIICFEELENGLHPWLLHQMIEILQEITTTGIDGKPIQVILTSHSPTLLSYLDVAHVRLLELDNEGKTTCHPWPQGVTQQQFEQRYEDQLGDLWFSDGFETSS